MKNLIRKIFKLSKYTLKCLGVSQVFLEKLSIIIKPHSVLVEEVDFFLSGSFHFEPSSNSLSIGLQQRLYLTTNEWDKYFNVIKLTYSNFEKRNFSHKKLYNNYSVINVAFFCSYFDSHFYEQTIKVYNEIYPLIKWIICTINEPKVPPEGSNYFRFNSIEDAKYFVENFADIVIDADGPMRPTPALSLLNSVNCLVINYYNLISTGSDRLYDAIIVPSDVDISPLVLEKEIVRLECLGAWYFEKFNINSDVSTIKWDFAIISEQFKFGFDFYSSFGTLTEKHKIIFIGMKAESIIINKMMKFGWNIRNVKFVPHMHFEDLRRFLDKNVLTVLDVRNYSSGSGTILALSAGVPTICYRGKYWINQMAASIMNKVGFSEFIYTDISQIPFIVSKYRKEYKHKHISVMNDSFKCGYLKPDIFLPDFHKAMIILLNRFGVSGLN